MDWKVHSKVTKEKIFLRIWAYHALWFYFYRKNCRIRDAYNFTDVRYKYMPTRERRCNILSENCIAESNKTEKWSMTSSSYIASSNYFSNWLINLFHGEIISASGVIFEFSVANEIEHPSDRKSIFNWIR